LELEEVPVVLVDPEDPEVEIDKMVASNVYRRTIDAFAMFPYIGKLRRGASSIAKKGQTGLGSDDIAAQVHKPQKFVSAADVFNAMGKEEKEAIEGWHREKADRSETALIAELRKIEKEALKSDEKYDELVDSTRSYQEREATLQEMLEDRDGQIAELTDVDHEGEIEDRDAKIRLLQNQKRKLSQKLKETQETPDLHAILSDAIGKQLSVNSVLKEIVEYKDSLNQNMLTELLDAVYRTVEILKGVQTTEQNAQKEITQ